MVRPAGIKFLADMGGFPNEQLSHPMFSFLLHPCLTRLAALGMVILLGGALRGESWWTSIALDPESSSDLNHARPFCSVTMTHILVSFCVRNHFRDAAQMVRYAQPYTL